MFVGTYPPRECGIATFNQDLLSSAQKLLGSKIACKALALNYSPLSLYIYPPEVEWKIDQNNKKEYVQAAKKLSAEPLVTGIVIQHEYGIYGGVDGENILSFMENCSKAMFVTLHTVLPTPSIKLKDVTGRIIKRANTVVVLTQNSKEILESLYPEAINKVRVIPHGIHQTEFEVTAKAKRKLKLGSATVLSTFGLLSRGKGIEYVIKALPSLVKKYPDVLYLILGETHPVVRRSEGESYRNELTELVAKLHLKKHVRFYDQYLSLGDLLEFLKATDIYVSSSINPNQSVSGTLSYALGAGRAVVSTEFAQAKELLTPDVGRLVPITNSKAYSLALGELLANKTKLKKMHREAYKKTRPMLWSNVASLYSKLLKQNILPPIKLKHLEKMTDEFGLFQFAKYNTPDTRFGYTLDDNARALIMVSSLTSKNPTIEKLVSTYVCFIKKCQQLNGTFINYLDYAKKTTKQNDEEGLEDASARAMWALAVVLSNQHAQKSLRSEARKMFMKAFPTTLKFKHLRAKATLIKAFAIAAASLPHMELTEAIYTNANLLISELAKNSIKNWQWFETQLRYNNGILPESLFIAWRSTGKKLYLEKGKQSLSFLIKKTFSENRYIPIGHSHWYKKGAKRSHFDQQPEDPASTILALATAYEITHDEKYRNLINICFSWFLGNNSLEVPLYNYQTGGCYDGLHPDRVNLNQGAESLVSYLLSRLAIARLNNYENKANKEHLP